MATGWTDVTSGSGGAGEIQGDVDDVGADGFFEPVRASLIACAHSIFHMGGSRIQAITAITPTWEPILEYEDFDVPAAKEGGFSYEAVVEGAVANAATSVTIRLRNTTDSTTEFTGTAITSTSFTKQTTAFTPVAGKNYRFEAIRSNNTHDAWVKAKIVRRDS